MRRSMAAMFYLYLFSISMFVASFVYSKFFRIYS